MLTKPPSLSLSESLAEVIRPLPTPTPQPPQQQQQQQSQPKNLFAVGEVEKPEAQREHAAAESQPSLPSEPRPMEECLSILRNPEVRGRASI